MPGYCLTSLLLGLMLSLLGCKSTPPTTLEQPSPYSGTIQVKRSPYNCEMGLSLIENKTKYFDSETLPGSLLITVERTLNGPPVAEAPLLLWFGDAVWAIGYSDLSGQWKVENLPPSDRFEVNICNGSSWRSLPPIIVDPGKTTFLRVLHP